MTVDSPEVETRYGEAIDFGSCLVGRNLNLLTIRGFGTLDELAIVSAPDVYDMVDNKTGTQRDLKRSHADECMTYSMGSANLPEDDPRFFPEILLNVRDMNVIDLYNLDDTNELYDFNSFADESELETPFSTGLRIRLSAIEFPKKTKGPQISRVDGNHRLAGADNLLEALLTGDGEEKDSDFPIVPFAMLLDLNPNQEAKLFRDINGEHMGMEVAHLDTLIIRITNPQDLRDDPTHRPLWIAHQLCMPGRSFEDMVFMGGSRAGVKRLGLVPPIRINSLKSTIHQQVKSAPTVSTALLESPEALVNIIDNFWRAVRNVFPEAWNNKRDFILLQAIGLGAFAKFGGAILERAFDDERVSQADFEQYLAPVAENVPLTRKSYPGVAGAGGQQLIADLLMKAAGPEAVKTERVKDKLQKKKSIDEALGIKHE
jgi:DGQHR domain-containing protein